jgi:hypothetical protein
MSALSHYWDLRNYNVLYDIACQYHKKLKSRIESLPEPLQQDLSDKLLRWFINKFHLKAHGPDCQANFSLYTSKGVGWTHSSNMEQEWSHSKKLAPSTCEMGHGAQHAVLNDYWNWWNFALMLALGLFLPMNC